MKLFHFSDDPHIKTFVPRPVLVPSKRREGQEWLNGPLVWAIDQDHDFLYLFPRECPRIVAWAHSDSAEEDRTLWLGNSSVAAFIEASWLEELKAAVIYRYELQQDHFESLNDAGMWVSRREVRTLRQSEVIDMPAALKDRGVTLKVVDTLAPLKALWNSSLSASGIRLRNASSWKSA